MEQPTWKKDNWDDQTNYVCELIINPDENCGQTDNKNLLIKI